MSRIVVSGATGFLGGHLCRRLKAVGHEVIGLGRNAEAGAALTADGIQFEAGDLGHKDDLTAVATADAFVHSAGLASPWGRYALFEQANVTATRNALTMAERLGVRRFVFISSPSIYFAFADRYGVREDDPLPPPVNAYAATKVIGETLVKARTGLGPIILRPRGLYGHGDTALLPRMMRAAKRGPLPLLRGGMAVFDLTYIDDVVDACLLALDAPKACEGKAYNISGGDPMPIREVIERAARLNGVEARFRPLPLALVMAAARLIELGARLTPGQPEPAITAYSIGVLAYSQTLDLAAARQDLGYAPKVTFAEGLRRTFGGIA